MSHQDKKPQSRFDKFKADRIKWVKGHVPESIVFAVIAACTILYCILKPYTNRNFPVTTAVIRDSVRHYPPVVRGGEIIITCQIVNTNDSNSLVITDIQPTDFSVEQISANPKIIPPKDSAAVAFVYTADKEVGFAEHKIRFYGNIKNTGMLTLTFDTHVVRPSGDASDYEDIYFRDKQPIIEELIDGDLGERGYTTDSTAIAAPESSKN